MITMRTEKSNTGKIDIVDFHAHVLPKADHGSNSVKQSISQLKIAKKAGVTRIIATPHFYPHRHSVSSFLKRRKASYAALIGSGAITPDMPEIRLGAEVLLFENIDKMPDLKMLCIEGTNYLLLELPFADLTDEHVETAAKIMQLGITVVIAHADRYDREWVEKFIKIGALIQLNADAFTFIRKRPHLLNWVDARLVVGLGSDIHGPRRRFYNNFVNAQKKIGESLSLIVKFSDKIWEESKALSLK